VKTTAAWTTSTCRGKPLNDHMSLLTYLRREWFTAA
jgi:hypothetical protein